MPLIQSLVRNSTLFVEFSHPETRNSFSIQAAEELDAILSAVKASALVFLAPGRVFCSGGNLSDYAGMSEPAQGKAVNRRISAVLHRLSQLEIPTVCAVTGDCFGGGVELLSAFDHVIAVPHVVFGLWQRRIGLTFGWGGGARLECRLGLARLRRLALSAESFDSRRALQFGLIDELSPVEAIVERAVERSRRLASLPSAPLKYIKKSAAENELDHFEKLWWNPEHRTVLEKIRKNS
jgi:enoyl-CoA hydratase/carnithine racemase